jgi:cell wall-associated NlpC family hydrolase
MKTILLLLTGVLTMRAGTAATAVDSLLLEARKSLAPDRRTAVFDVRGELQGETIVLKGELQSEELRTKLLRFLEEREAPVVDSLIALPHPSLGAATFGVVSISVANIRTKPGHDEEMGTQALLGTPVRLLKGERGGWFLVQTPDEYLGWSDDHIVRMTKEELDVWNAKPKVIVTAEFAFVRASLDPSSDVVSDVTVGGVLGLIRDVGSAYEVVFPDGRTGYLAGTAAEPLGPWLAHAQDTPETVVATAKRFFGVPYFWGGTSAKGLDCSGFTKTVYYLNGVLLPRDADQQALVGEPVELTEDFSLVRPGDILYFGSKRSEKRPARVTHVAISLGGKRFIHASSYVMLNSFDPADSDYAPGRAKSLLGVRRIIGADERTGVRHLSYLETNRP